MKFNVDRHFIYIIAHTDENKEKLQYYYKMIEEDLEEIIKEWSANLLVSTNPVEMSDIDSLEVAQNTPGPSKTKKTNNIKKDEDIQNVDSRSVRTASITPEQVGNGKDLEEVEQRPADEAKIIKKRKG